MVFDSSTVMTPSLPTFFIASAMMPPICLSLLAEMVPTWAIISPLTSLWSFLISSTACSTALSIPRLRAVGLAPAATVFTPSRKMACASTVAVVVPSPATSDVLEATSRTICAPMFSRGSLSSISFATVTPSLVITGAPNFFSITALRPLGPRVIFTASARMFTPRRIDWRELSPVTICLAISQFLLRLLPQQNSSSMPRNCLLPGSCGLGCARQFGQDFFFFQDQQLFIFNLDFRAAVLSEEHAITRLDVQVDQFPLFTTAWTNSNDLALLLLFFRGIRNDDASPDAFLLFNA